MIKTKFTITEEEILELLRKPEYYHLKPTWTDCIKPNKYLDKQYPCQSKKCPSEQCNRARNSKEYLYQLINHSILPPDYFVVLKFTPESDLLSEDEKNAIFDSLRKKIRYISKCKSKKKPNPPFSYYTKCEFSEGQPHFHLKLTFEDDNHDDFSAEIVKNKLIQIFKKTLTELENSGELISEVRPDKIYFDPVRSPEATARYLAKAEKDLPKHEPVPSHYRFNRKKLSSCSRNHHPVTKKELAHIKKVISAKKMGVNKDYAVINENEKSQIKIFVQPDSQTITSNEVIFQDYTQTEETGCFKHHNRMVHKFLDKQVIITKPSSRTWVSKVLLKAVWGFALVGSLVFVVSKIQSLPEKPQYSLELKQDKSQRAKFMHKWFLDNGFEYHQNE